MRISAIWWNTSLSPPQSKPDRLSEEDRGLFVEVFSEFLVKQNVDVIGLCEISKKDATWITLESIKYGYKVQSGIVKAGKTNFDTCVVYRADKLEFVDQNKLVYEEFNRSTKIALQLLFRIIGDSRPFHLFTLHWPSRRYSPKNDPNRIMFGKILRGPIQQIFDMDIDAYKNSLVVVMGDFNDEPFDASLTDGLSATRDRALISRRPHLLYNPFWRFLGGRDDYSSTLPDTNYSGTYFYSGGLKDRWHTFDQIIISSAFLGISDWHLVENETEIVDFPRYTERVLNVMSKFDHLPIKIVLERV